MKKRIWLDKYSLMFDEHGYLVSIRNDSRFFKFKQVSTLRDLITNLGKDELTISDLYQLLNRYSNPKVEVISGRTIVSEVLL